MQKRIFITGAASGIGHELAKRYTQQGDIVVLFDRQNTEETEIELKKISASLKPLSFIIDVCDVDNVNEAFSRAAQFGLPDIVINCAGIALALPFSETSSEQFNRVISVNLIGSRNVAAAALPHLKPGSQLVFIASMAGLMGCYGYNAYCASKHGVVGLADVLRIELKSQGIDVSVVCPPEVETPMVVEERRYRPKATETMKLLAGQLTVDEACIGILKGIRFRKFLIIPGKRANILQLINKISPTFVSHFISDYITRKEI